MRKALLVGETDIDRYLVQILERQPVLAERLADLENDLLAEIGDDIDRIELGDLGERRRLRAADDVAGIDKMLADDTVERGADLGIGKIDLGDGDLGAGALELRRRALTLEILVIDLGLRGGMLLEESGIAAEFDLRIVKRRLLQLHLRARLLELLLVGILLDREQEIAFFDKLAVLVMDLLEIAFDPREQLDLVDRCRIAGKLDVVGHGLPLGQHDRHRDGGAWRRQLRRLDESSRRTLGAQSRFGGDGVS